MFTLAGFHLRALHPAFLQEFIDQHFKQLHGGMIFSTSQNRRAETTQPSAYCRPRGNRWQHTVEEVFEKLPEFSPELLFLSRSFPLSQELTALGYQQEIDLSQWQQTSNDWEPCTPPIAPLTARGCSSWCSEKDSKQNGRPHRRLNTYNRQQTEDGQNLWQLKQN